MSVREINTNSVPLPEVEFPEFKAPATVLSKWERFKRNFDLKYRSSLTYALLFNILFLVAILVLLWVSVAFEGFFNPSTILGLFSLPILLAIYDALRLMEQEKETNKKKYMYNKK
ncbi:MAG: hypothetical protein ACTSRT_17815 [Promethearchaeota archaeon]